MEPARQSQLEICEPGLKPAVALARKFPTGAMPLRSYGMLE